MTVQNYQQLNMHIRAQNSKQSSKQSSKQRSKQRPHKGIGDYSEEEFAAMMEAAMPKGKDQQAPSRSALATRDEGSEAVGTAGAPVGLQMTTSVTVLTQATVTIGLSHS